VPYLSQQLSRRNVAAALVIALVAACGDSGPSDSEFITACLAEGERGANKMMRREMGVKGEDFCKCGAKEARSAMSPQARQAMVFGMQGKKAEAHAIGEKMSPQEQDAFMKGTMTLFTACAGKPR
jgi:hypothetical protein